MAAPRLRDITSHRSLGELLNELTDSVTQLVRDEIRLAKVETVESLLTLRRGAIWIGIGSAVALCAAAAGIASLIMVISRYLLDGSTWLSALIVAGALAIAAGLCLLRGTSSLAGASLIPNETATSIRETAKWPRHRAKSADR